MKMQYKYLRFEDMSLGRAERKDLTYICYRIDSGNLIGWIERYSNLKEFRFTGCETTEFNYGECLELLSFIKQVNKKFFKK